MLEKTTVLPVLVNSPSSPIAMGCWTVGFSLGEAGGGGAGQSWPWPQGFSMCVTRMLQKGISCHLMHSQRFPGLFSGQALCSVNKPWPLPGGCPWAREGVRQIGS